jgi:tartrate dehydrogenase/decarboxylase/D-malate dehydrogenase
VLVGKTYRIAVIPGDGIGKEVVPEGLRVLDATARALDFSLEHLGEPAGAAAVLAAIEDVVGGGGDALTPDLGGSGTTVGFGTAIAEALR